MDDLLRIGAILAGFWTGGAVPTWWTLRTHLPDLPAGEQARFVAFWPVSWLLLARARCRTLMEHNDQELL